MSLALTPPAAATYRPSVRMSEQQRLQRARDFLLQAVETLGESRSDSLSQSTERAAVHRSASVTPRSAIFTRSTDSICRSASVTSAVAERNKLFHYKGHPKSKKKRLCLWTHDFVCLSKTTDSKAPTSFEAGELLRAGLGKKQLSLMENGDSSDVTFMQRLWLAFRSSRKEGVMNYSVPVILVGSEGNLY